MNLADLQSQLESMPLLTGKQCSTYICGVITYEELKKRLDIPAMLGEGTPELRVMGVFIYPHPLAPDNGRFYPADYLEARIRYPPKAS